MFALLRARLRLCLRTGRCCHKPDSWESVRPIILFPVRGSQPVSLTSCCRYLDRLEKRLGDVERALQQVQGVQCAGLTPTRQDVGRDQDADGWESNARSRPSPPIVFQDGGGIGEVDTAEDSIDGMGAIKFTDEEDWGYFGKLREAVIAKILRTYGSPLLIRDKVRPRTSPSYATSPSQWHAPAI